MRRNRESSSVLIKASPNSTFDILLQKAQKEGRIGGTHRCAVCGMTHQTEGEAFTCCAKLRERPHR